MRQALLISLVSALAVALVIQGGFPQMILLALAIDLAAPPLLIIVAIIGVARIRRKTLDPNYRRFVAVLALVIISSIFSFLIGCGIHQLRWNATRQYVAALVPLLDDAKQRTGRFPMTLPSEPSSFDRILSFPLKYSVSKTGFEFWYDDPEGMMDSYSLDSDHRSWKYHG